MHSDEQQDGIFAVSLDGCDVAKELDGGFVRMGRFKQGSLNSPLHLPNPLVAGWPDDWMTGWLAACLLSSLVRVFGLPQRRSVKGCIATSFFVWVKGTLVLTYGGHCICPCRGALLAILSAQQGGACPAAGVFLGIDVDSCFVGCPQHSHQVDGGCTPEFEQAYLVPAV